VSRAEKSRNASRLYRQRKKQFMEELKQQLDRSSEEKQVYIQDHQKQEILLQRLMEENSRLKNERAIDNVSQLGEQRKELIKELEDKMAQQAPGVQIEAVLNQIKSHNVNVTKLGTTHLEEFISPTKVSTVIISEFFKMQIPMMTQPLGGNLSQFATRIVNLVPNLSSDQISTIKSLVEKHTRDLEKLKIERNSINDEIERSINTRPLRQKNSEILLMDFLGVTETLEELKKNLENETSLWDTALAELLGVLSVHQRATFVLHSEYRNAGLQQLKYLWGAFYGGTDV